MSGEPIWLDWVESEVTDLTGEQLRAFVDEWHGKAERYLREQQRGQLARGSEDPARRGK